VILKTRAYYIIFLLFLLSLSLLSCDKNSSELNENSDLEADSDMISEEGEAEDEFRDVEHVDKDFFDENFFAKDHVIEVKIEIDEKSWDTLRMQQKTFLSVFGEENCEKPMDDSVYTYFPADVTINGAKLLKVGVRKKGFIGSQSVQRPSLKIKFHEYIENQELHGIKRMTLNNNRQDPSKISQCLAYGLMSKAGIPSPRCNFVHLFVNGEDFGIYTQVESIKKPFLKRNFGEDSGNLYEGTVADFRKEERWQVRFQKKTNEKDNDWSDIKSLISILELPESEFLPELGNSVDLDSFITFWVMELLTGHWDGYTGNRNNFYFYKDPRTDRFFFIPWGTDGTFRMPEQGRPNSVNANGILARRLYNNEKSQELYIKELKKQLDIWKSAKIIAEIDTLKEIVEPYITEYEKVQFEEKIGSIKSFATEMKNSINEELKDGPASWDMPDGDPPCFVIQGSIKFDFETYWGTIPPGNTFWRSEGFFEMELLNNSYSSDTIGAGIGYSEDPNREEDDIELILGALMENEDLFIIVVYTSKEYVKPGKVLHMTRPDSEAYLLFKPKDQEDADMIGFIEEGTLAFIKGEIDDLAPVKAVLDSPVWMMK